MARGWRVSAFAMLVAFGGAAVAQGPSEAEVRAVIERMDRAGDNRDVDTIAGLLGEGVQISGTLSAQGTVVERYRYDKRTYLAALREAWAQTSAHTQRRSNLRIVVSGAVATATSDLTATATVAGGILRTQGRETATFERANGAVVVTRVIGDANVSGEPR